MLWKDSDLVHRELYRRKSGQPPPYQRPAYVELDANIYQLIHKYTLEKDSLRFLRSVSYNMSQIKLTKKRRDTEAAATKVLNKRPRTKAAPITPTTIQPTPTQENESIHDQQTQPCDPTPITVAVAKTLPQPRRNPRLIPPNRHATRSKTTTVN